MSGTPTMRRSVLVLIVFALFCGSLLLQRKGIALLQADAPFRLGWNKQSVLPDLPGVIYAGPRRRCIAGHRP